MASTKTLSRHLIVFACIVFSKLSFAVADGCSPPRELIEIFSNGTPVDLENKIIKITAQKWEQLSKKSQNVLSADLVAVEKWRNEIKDNVINKSIPCTHGIWGLDQAVAYGNFEMIRWLVENGSDPNAANPKSRASEINLASTIFSRCGALLEQRPNKTKTQIIEEAKKAYDYLIKLGANLNHHQHNKGIEDPLIHCSDPDMVLMFISLGAITSRSDADSVGGNQNYSRLAALKKRIFDANEYDKWWVVVEELARYNNDLRGTHTEKTLRQYAFPPNPQNSREYFAHHSKTASNLHRLSKIIRFSPGFFPEAPPIPEDVPKAFPIQREVCSFPEIDAYPDFNFLMVIYNALPNEKDKPLTPEIFIGRTKTPVLLVLHNPYWRQANWTISTTSESNIIGVIHHSAEGEGDKDQVHFDSRRPVFFSHRNNSCALMIYKKRGVDSFYDAKPLFSIVHPSSWDPFERGRMPRVIHMGSPALFINGSPELGNQIKPIHEARNLKSWQAWANGDTIQNKNRIDREVFFADSSFAFKWLDDSDRFSFKGLFKNKKYRFPEFWNAYVISGQENNPVSKILSLDKKIFFLEGGKYGKYNYPDDITVYFYRGKLPSDLDGQCIGPRCFSERQ